MVGKHSTRPENKFLFSFFFDNKLSGEPEKMLPWVGVKGNCHALTFHSGGEK